MKLQTIILNILNNKRTNRIMYFATYVLFWIIYDAILQSNKKIDFISTL